MKMIVGEYTFDVEYVDNNMKKYLEIILTAITALMSVVCYGSIDNIDDYDTIFIGGPIWWGTYPQVMFTFFSKYDLNGKTIIPFTTHEGSGLGSVVSDLKKAYPNASLKAALSIYGHDVRTSGKKSVEGWLKKLGF